MRRSSSAAAVLLTLLAVPAVAEAASFAEVARRGAGPAFLFALTWGFLTALTPCVYPMIPITAAMFGAQSGTKRRRALLLATVYVGGIAFTYGLLGTVFALLGKTFGSQLGNPWFAVPLAVVFVALGLSMLGVWSFVLPHTMQERLVRVGGKGILGAFLMGLVAGVIAAPCTGPPLAGILAYVATTKSAVFGFALLATYAVGIGVPFWLLAATAMSLPRPGRWMEAVKSAFAIVLFTAALYYLRPLLPFLVSSVGASRVFLALALAALALGLALGAIHLDFASPGRAARKTAALLLSTAGAYMLVAHLLTPRIEAGTERTEWLTSHDQAVERARRTNTPLLIDFWAEWCLPCKEMEIEVLNHPEVMSELRHFTLLKVDISDGGATALTSKYEAEVLPALRVVSPDGRILARIDRKLNVRAFLEIVGEARRKSGP